MTVSREIHLASRPSGWPTPENFALVEVQVPALGEGELLVRNTYLSVDPYMRGRMNEVRSYADPYQVGQVLYGGALGEVVASTHPDLEVGRTVLHNQGWREYAWGPATQFRAVDPAAAPTPSAYLGVLGMPGLTAYVGLLDIASFTDGDAVFVSGAAGAVGSIAGQIAKAKGASRIVGSAGSAAKVAYVEGLGFDAAFDYHDGAVHTLLRKAAPDGIDVYFDNVGGDHLEAAIGALRLRGRVAMCGSISAYNASEDGAPGPRNLGLATGKRLTLRGYIVSDHGDRMRAFVSDMSQWLRDGTVRYHETFVDGLAHAPDAFLGLLRGENTGKMIVRL